MGQLALLTDSSNSAHANGTICHQENRFVFLCPLLSSPMLLFIEFSGCLSREKAVGPRSQLAGLEFAKTRSSFISLTSCDQWGEKKRVEHTSVASIC